MWNSRPRYITVAGGWSTPGNEIIYSYTAPTTGAYSISQTNSFTFIDYQYKLASSGCGATGWTCIDDMTGNATSPTFNLSAGIIIFAKKWMCKEIFYMLLCVVVR